MAAARSRQSAGVSVGMPQDGFPMLCNGEYQGKTIVRIRPEKIDHVDQYL